VQFYTVYIQLCKGTGSVEHVFSGFIGQSQNNMGTNLDSPIGGGSDRIFKALNIVTPIDQRQRCIIGRLQTVFNPDQVSLRVILQ